MHILCMFLGILTWKNALCQSVHVLCIKKWRLSCFFLLLSHSKKLVHLWIIFLCTVNLCYVCCTCYSLCLLFFYSLIILHGCGNCLRVTSIKKFYWLVSELVTSPCFPWYYSFILCQSRNFLFTCTALFTESAIWPYPAPCHTSWHLSAVFIIFLYSAFWDYHSTYS